MLLRKKPEMNIFMTVVVRCHVAERGQRLDGWLVHGTHRAATKDTEVETAEACGPLLDQFKSMSRSELAAELENDSCLTQQFENLSGLVRLDLHTAIFLLFGKFRD